MEGAVVILNSMISVQLKPSEMEVIAGILGRFLPPQGYSAFIFGSRADGKPRRFSDIDIAVVGDPLSPGVKADIEDAFETSSLPIKVDLVEWYKLGDRFKSVAREAMVPIELKHGENK